MFTIQYCNIPQDKTAAKRVRIGRRTDDQIVDRIIESKFSSLDIVHRETHTVNGELLRDRLARDKREIHDGGRLGACYYRDLLMEWSSGQIGWAELRPELHHEAVSDSLIKALELCSDSNPNVRTIEPLTAMLRNAAAFNQTEVYGAVKAIAANSVLGHQKKDAVIQNMMEYLVRVGQHDKWPQLMRVFARHIKQHPVKQPTNQPYKHKFEHDNNLHVVKLHA